MRKDISYLAVFLLISSAFLLSFSTGCSHSHKIDEDKFVRVYTDIVIAQDTSNADVKQMESIKKKIFMRYNITGAQYDSTLSYYNADPERWEKFFDKTIKYVEGLRDKAKEKKK